MSALLAVARFLRGLCVGIIMAAVLENHGWAWFVVVGVLWIAHVIVEIGEREHAHA